MDFGFLFYMGLMTLCFICYPPLITIVIVGIVFTLNKTKVIAVSNQQILVFGIIFFILALMGTCVFVQIASSGVYAM